MNVLRSFDIVRFPGTPGAEQVFVNDRYEVLERPICCLCWVSAFSCFCLFVLDSMFIDLQTPSSLRFAVSAMFFHVVHVSKKFVCLFE